MTDADWTKMAIVSFWGSKIADELRVTICLNSDEKFSYGVLVSANVLFISSASDLLSCFSFSSNSKCLKIALLYRVSSFLVCILFILSIKLASEIVVTLVKIYTKPALYNFTLFDKVWKSPLCLCNKESSYKESIMLIVVELKNTNNNLLLLSLHTDLLPLKCDYKTLKGLTYSLWLPYLRRYSTYWRLAYVFEKVTQTYENGRLGKLKEVKRRFETDSRRQHSTIIFIKEHRFPDLLF